MLADEDYGVVAILAVRLILNDIPLWSHNDGPHRDERSGVDLLPDL